MFWHRDLRRLRDSRTEAEHVQTWLLLPLLPRALSCCNWSPTTLAGADRSAHLTAGFTRVRLTESQSAIAAAALQLAVELPFPTLLLPS